MRNKWLIAGLLGAAELAVVGAMVLAARGGLTWQNVLGFAWPIAGGGGFSATADQDQSFAVGQAASLDVESTFGAITVTGGTGHEIAVHAHKTGWGADQAAADAALAALKITLTQSGNAVTVKVEQPSGLIVLNQSHNNGVDFTVAVPSDAAVKAHTSFGDVQVAGASGGVDARTSAGRAGARLVSGPVVLHSDFGPVSLENATVSTVNARSSSGSVTLSQVAASGAVELHSDFGPIEYQGGRAASLTARTSNGRVTLTGLAVDGAADARSDFGSLTVSQVTAGSYAVNSSNGSISIDGAAGTVQASSDFGQVSVVHAAGVTLDLHSSNGTVTFSGSLGAGPHSLTSDFGNVTLSLPANTAADVDLSTGFGSIHSTLPVTASGDLSREHLAGALNGGGPRLTVKTSNGNITLDTLSS
jgi:DUF4097 and DUF4098 domain-containing protein YvlB